MYSLSIKYVFPKSHNGIYVVHEEYDAENHTPSHSKVTKLAEKKYKTTSSRATTKKASYVFS
ncbi:hypothetical protein [Proteiniphilum sp. UBA5384]|uniref:hypothetical protein n=1 Tax=Proteiniphilum sp. UBA5384 TaxID=1947279 RepID=UPI0025EE2648|nr:hypothetical protein [Proteiniphilum sp. UBA5384]